MSERSQHANEDNPQQQKLDGYIRELLAEKSQIDEAKHPHAWRLIDEEIQKAQASGRVPFKEFKFIDVYRERPVKVTVKVLVPVREHPRYNFIGKLLGPKGNTLKQLQEETMCHISICGRGSIRDRQKEEELRQSLEPKFAHLHDDLHMDINTLAPPAEAHARIAFALAEVRKYLIPEYGEGGRQEVFMEIMSKPKHFMREDRPPPKKPVAMMRGGGGGGARPPPPPAMGGGRPPASTSRMHPKSILDRARVAVDDYDEYEASPEYEDYRDRGVSAPRSSYQHGRDYEDNYGSDYYRENRGQHYSVGGHDFGYKKRKTFME